MRTRAGPHMGPHVRTPKIQNRRRGPNSTSGSQCAVAAAARAYMDHACPMLAGAAPAAAMPHGPCGMRMRATVLMRMRAAVLTTY